MTRNVIVTGGGTGIGRACAEHFCSIGDNVFITGRRQDVLVETAVSIGARPVTFDASDPEGVSKACSEVPNKIDVLVNCAGGNTDLSQPKMTDISQSANSKERLQSIAEGWRANMASNVLSAVLTTAALEPRFVNSARIVTIGSIASRLGSGSYGAAKAAIEAWTIDIARALGPRKITANVVSPGLTEGTEFFHGKLTEERKIKLVEATFTKQAGQVEDIVEAVKFLTSAGARHITGQIIPVNGGAQLAR